jgi:hypothetical protein
VSGRQVKIAQGRVRGVHIGESPQAGEYARIRLAGDSGYFMDFDQPDFWDGIQGQHVEVSFYETERDKDGVIYTYRVVGRGGGRMKAAQDFVGIYRWALDDLAERVDEGTLGLFIRLLAEANYKTGYVRGSVRAIAAGLGIDRRRLARALNQLEDEVEVRVDQPRNQHEGGGVAILRYSEYVHSGKRAGTGAGTSGGTEMVPAHSADQPNAEMASPVRLKTLLVHQLVPFTLFTLLREKTRARVNNLLSKRTGKPKENVSARGCVRRSPRKRQRGRGSWPRTLSRYLNRRKRGRRHEPYCDGVLAGRPAGVRGSASEGRHRAR